MSVQYQGVGTSSRTDDMFFWLGQDSTNRYRDYPNGMTQSSYRAGTVDVAVNGQGVEKSNNVRHLSWQDMYATWVRTIIRTNIFKEPYQRGNIDYNTYNATYTALTAVVNSTAADSRLSQICQAAKDEGVIIYTIAFEAPYGGQAALADCASSPSHYFDVAGTDISDAFSAIASDIKNLKLTQ
jgi:hypothetical protein